MNITVVKSKKLNCRNNGFSLIELVIVMAIMVILTAFIAPNLIDYIAKSRTARDSSNAHYVAQAIMVMFASEGIDPETASRSSFYSSGDYSVGRADLIDIVSELSGVPVSDIGFSNSAGQW